MVHTKKAAKAAFSKALTSEDPGRLPKDEAGRLKELLMDIQQIVLQQPDDNSRRLGKEICGIVDLGYVHPKLSA